jgi:GntR family transcriptional regulator/MocR family aminotransferase
VRTARAINCVPEQVLITAGSQQALHLAARVLLNPGDTVAIEDPSCPAARQVFESAAARILPLVVDEHGLVVEGALGKNQAVRAVYVTPSHQYPPGMPMSSPVVQLMSVPLRDDLRARL